MEQTTSRLRKTFHYPAEDDSEDDLPEALDEEEQESIIQTLQHKNATINRTYTHFLLAIPLLSTIPYLTTLFSTHTGLLSLLSITSLLSTSYLLYTLPPSLTGLPFLDAYISASTPPSQPQRRRIPLSGAPGPRDGPIATYLPYLNLGLCVVLVGLGGVVERRFEVWWGFGWLPGLVWGVVVLAKWIMGGVDPESELGGLRYGYKGA